jgi:hypothetical protein
MSPAAAAVVSSLPIARVLVQRCTREDRSAGVATGISGAFSDMFSTAPRGAIDTVMDETVVPAS